MKLGFCDRLSKYTQIPNFMKIRPMGAELLRADRRTDGRGGKQTDMTKLMVAFRNFANAPDIGVDHIGMFFPHWKLSRRQNPEHR